jgi:two-component system nitrogen regulation response regulator NtrX
MSSESILIIDDEAEVRSLVSDVLSDEGYVTSVAADEQEAFAFLKKSIPDLIFLDLWIGDDESAGLKILKKIKKINRDVPIVIISGHGNVDVAVQAIQNGAADFIEKPFVIERLLVTSKRSIEMHKLKKENSILKNNKLDTEVFSVGASQFATTISSTIEKIASTNSRIFIKSSTGIGADTIAFWIHKQSQRREYPFVCVNCALDDGEKLETELFGSEKSYGYLEKANGGTLFLEDVIRLSKNSQRRLLQFLQDGIFIVDNKKVYSDVRVICSSHDNVDNFVDSEKFSKELFYRLNIVNLNIPALKDRREDVIPTINYYCTNAEVFFGLKSKKITNGALAILQSYDWPGNIHQIKNVVESSIINSLGKDDIDKDSIPSELTSSTQDKFDALNVAKLISLPIKEAKEHFEHDYLQAQVIRFSGNISQTSAFVKMERSALHRKLKSLGIRADRKLKKDQK